MGVPHESRVRFRSAASSPTSAYKTSDDCSTSCPARVRAHRRRCGCPVWNGVYRLSRARRRNAGYACTNFMLLICSALRAPTPSVSSSLQRASELCSAAMIYGEARVSSGLAADGIPVRRPQGADGQGDAAALRRRAGGRRGNERRGERRRQDGARRRAAEALPRRVAHPLRCRRHHAPHRRRARRGGIRARLAHDGRRLSRLAALRCGDDGRAGQARPRHHAGNGRRHIQDHAQSGSHPCRAQGRGGDPLSRYDRPQGPHGRAPAAEPPDR